MRLKKDGSVRLSKKEEEALYYLEMVLDACGFEDSKGWLLAAAIDSKLKGTVSLVDLRYGNGLRDVGDVPLEALIGDHKTYEKVLKEAINLNVQLPTTVLL